jgi:hypothetical protein
MTPDELRARNRRSIWIALAIGAFIVLVFFVTMARVKAGLPP